MWFDPNFKPFLLTACSLNTFGWNCEHQCTVSISSCSDSVFCMPDPLGCSCMAGFYGQTCQNCRFLHIWVIKLTIIVRSSLEIVNMLKYLQARNRCGWGKELSYLASKSSNANLLSFKSLFPKTNKQTKRKRKRKRKEKKTFLVICLNYFHH